MGGTAPRISLSQVFIELPSSRTLSRHTPHVPSTGHKENALSTPCPVSSQMNSSTSVHSKRKLSVDTSIPDQPAPKKHNHSMPPNASDEYPNGFVYCHQCNKKRDATVTVRCTAKDSKGRRCNAKYCKPCLKNRYGLLLEDILADGETDQDNHVHGEGYYFRCPRCGDNCNCVACRKAKGLQPTGNLANAARQSGLTSAADVLRRDPRAAGPMAHKPGEKQQHSAHGAAAASKQNSDNRSLSAPVKSSTRQPVRPAKPDTESSKPTKIRVRSLPRPKLLAKPIWTSVHTALSQNDAEERINIREFALRFSSILELSRSYQDELDEIRPSRGQDGDDDFIPWVSEACLKSLLLGLLNMVDAAGEREKHLKATMKSIRESSAHLNKMWAALATLRDWQESTSRSTHLTSTGFPLSFPDPLPPPESVSIIRTRSGASQSNTGSINVLRTAQLVPVISALVDVAVKSEAARQELEAGIQESREQVKEAREAHRIENERFEQEKEREKTRGKRLDKSRIEHHKRTVVAIDDALKVISYANITRISPLGRDVEGRVYWALTPGMNEREDALDLLRSHSQGRSHKSKSRRKPLVPSEEDRSALRKWSWFVAVWGKRPPVAERALVDDSDDNEDEDEDDEQWWGFWEPEQITKLASWIHFKAGLEDVWEHVHQQGAGAPLDSDMEPEDDEDHMEVNAIPTKSEIATLIRELEQYASVLCRRIQKDE